MMEIKLEDGIEIPEGYELDRIGWPKDGELVLGSQGRLREWCEPWVTSSPLVILKKKFVWPEWLKAAAIVKNEHGCWIGCDVKPYPVGEGWVTPGRIISLSPSLVDIEFPDDVEPEDSLILRPDLRGEK